MRFGKYPESLKDLKFVGKMDASIFRSVEDYKLDSGYELNFVGSYVPFNNYSDSTIHLGYPDEFWQGLGCLKSNLKK